MPRHKQLEYISPEEYLAREEVAEYKSEYANGFMFRMHADDEYVIPTASDISPEDFLARELKASSKSEYHGGYVCPLPDYPAHRTIVANLWGLLDAQVKKSSPRSVTTNTLLRMESDFWLCFYRPDVRVSGTSKPSVDPVDDAPIVMAEVMSKTTRRTDVVGKFDRYFSIPSVMTYLLLADDCPSVLVFRRINSDIEHEIYNGLDATIPLPEIGIELSLAEIYERVEFNSE